MAIKFSSDKEHVNEVLKNSKKMTAIVRVVSFKPQTQNVCARNSEKTGYVVADYT